MKWGKKETINKTSLKLNRKQQINKGTFLVIKQSDNKHTCHITKWGEVNYSKSITQYISCI